MANKIRIDTELDDNVSKKLNGISRAFDKLGGKGSGASLFGNVGAKAIAGGFNLISNAMSGAIDFAFDSIEAYSQLQQQMGGIEAVFGDASGSIEAFAETAADKFGLSKRAVFEAATVIGAKLQGMGLTAEEAAKQVLILQERGADMAATFGGSAADAISAMSSLLTGERDPIERYGVSIKEADVQARILALGLANVTTEERKQATATASLSLLMEQSAKAAGQSAREQDTLASKQAVANAKMENAQAILGEKLIPLQIAFTTFMIDVGIPALQSIAGALNTAGEAARGLGQMYAWAASMLGKLTGESQKYRKITGGPISGLANNPNVPHVGGGHAMGGWVGLHGPEMALVGEKGPEYITPNHKLGGMGGGLTIQGVSEREILDMVERGMYFRLRRAVPGA